MSKERDRYTSEQDVAAMLPSGAEEGEHQEGRGKARLPASVSASWLVAVQRVRLTSFTSCPHCSKARSWTLPA